MLKLLTLDILSVLFGSAGAVQDLGNLPETYCVTYLSTYIAAISSNATSSVSTNVVEGSSEVVGALSTELTRLDSEPITNVFTDSQSTTRRTEPGTTTIPTEPGLSGRSVVFRIVPDTQDSKRGLQKRALGGLVGSAQEDCNEASTFRLSKARLLDGTIPVFYGGEDFKELRGQSGLLPSGALLKRVVSFAFVSPLCQMVRRASVKLQVMVAYTSPLPRHLQTVSRSGSEECGDAAGLLEPIQPPTQPVTISVALPSDSDVTSAISFPTLKPSSDEAIQPNPVRTSSFLFSNTSSLAFLEAPTASSDDSLSTIDLPGTVFITTIPASEISLPPLFPTFVTDEIESSTTVDSFPTDTLSSQSMDNSEGISSSIMVSSGTSLFDATTLDSTADTSATRSIDSEVISTSMVESVSTAILESTSLIPTSETTTAETNTTTAGPTRACESYLINPTTLFSGDQAWDDESQPINLPFPVGIYTEFSDTLNVGVNGLLSLFDSRLTESENADLPVGTLPDVTIAAYWDNLRIPQNAGYEITYRVYNNEDGDGYRAVNIDWCVVDSNDVVTHFMVILRAYELSNPESVFMRYFASNGGISATIGV
ncbi:hypothetical protein NW768_004925 [Fusarium equiseti]|uniref:Uncharacterized protein n=1 Tax=Fusarium equiseti TaxID=61235 RepID=A0ABQ8RHM4_FUSEQ|nr:hypothetical protein NW768_004925 [Fusarium equiseti]